MRANASEVTLTGDGVEFALSVVDYQFPDAIDYWDGNWLVISGTIMHPRGPWRFQEACLTTFELRQLAEWLDGVAQGLPNPDFGYFTEPELRFDYLSEPQPALSLTLAYECAPSWLGIRAEQHEGARLIFPLSDNDPHCLAVAVRRLLDRFPVRYAA